MQTWEYCSIHSLKSEITDTTNLEEARQQHPDSLVGMSGDAILLFTTTVRFPTATNANLVSYKSESQALYDLGLLGWELVGVTSDDDGDVLYLKRDAVEGPKHERSVRNKRDSVSHPLPKKLTEKQLALIGGRSVKRPLGH